MTTNTEHEYAGALKDLERFVGKLGTVTYVLNGEKRILHNIYCAEVYWRSDLSDGDPDVPVFQESHIDKVERYKGFRALLFKGIQIAIWETGFEKYRPSNDLRFTFEMNR